MVWVKLFVLMKFFGGSGLSVSPSIFQSNHPSSPSDLSDLISSLPSLKFALSGLKSALSILKSILSGEKSALSELISIPRPRVSPLRYQISFQASNLLFWARNLPSKTKNQESGLQSALAVFKLAISGIKRMDEWKSPCVLQNFVPFGTAALLPLTPFHNHAKQGNGYCCLHTAIGRPV